MSQFDDLLATIPVSQLASRVGASEAETEQAVRQALPALLGGMKVNAEDPQGAQSLASALASHQSSPVVDEGVHLERVDPEDGRKIVGHVFGGNTDAVVNQLGGLGGGSSDLLKRLLPMLAPIVLAWLGKKLGGQLPGGAGAAPAEGQGGGGFGDILGGGGGGLGDLLGGILGGASGGSGSAQGGMGGLEDMLGSILRGGR